MFRNEFTILEMKGIMQALNYVKHVSFDSELLTALNEQLITAFSQVGEFLQSVSSGIIPFLRYAENVPTSRTNTFFSSVL
jgi:hypothetical protein